MSSDSVIRELFRSLEVSIHERLRMIEDVIQLGRQRFEGDDVMPGSLVDKIGSVEEMLTSLSSRLAVLESERNPDAAMSDTVHVNRIGIQQHVQPQSLWVNPMKDLEIHLPTVATPVVPALAVPVPAAVPVPVAVPEPEMEVESSIEQEEEEEAQEEDVVEAEAEEEEEEEEEAEEEEGEAVELEEFQFKNTTYYRDAQNQVYGLDADGELKEEPIGTWDLARQRVLFKRVA